MVPDPLLRIEAIKRALKNTILPLLPADQKAVRDQFQMVLATLDMLCDQLPFFHAMEVVELESLASLADELLAIIDQGPEPDAPADSRALVAQCRGAAQNPRAFTGDLQALGRQLRELVHNLTGRAAERPGPVFDQVAAVIVRFEEGHLQRERSWVASAGFDPYPDSLLSIPEALGLHSSDKAASALQGDDHDSGQ